MDNFTPANIAVGFVVTWGIGLMPPLLIRYAFLKRPMGKWPAIWVCGGFWFFSFLLYSAVSGSAKGHNALILVAMVSYWILRKDSTSQQNADAQLNVASPSPNTLKPSHATSNVSIYIPPQQPLPIQQVAMISESNMHTVSIGEPTLDEDAIYEVVANEMDSGKMDKGLWTRLYAEHDGDEKKTKIAYIKQRAEKLMAAERARLQELERKNAEEAALSEKRRLDSEEKLLLLGLKADELRLGKIHRLAQQHNNNPRMTIDEKEQLLRLAGGSFTWLDGHGKCAATFKGQERQFSSGQDFSIWFTREVVPFLISIPFEVAVR